jgi:predicted nucleic acid-binding Zn ribbon protein
MKKITSVFFLVSILFLTTTAFAEGDIPNGTKTCTQNCSLVESNNEKSAEADTFLPYSLIIKIQISLRTLFG